MSDDPAAPSPREEATEDVVAREEAERDDAGRGADDDVDTAGWRLQTRIFGGVAAFIGLIGVIYWFVSYEHAGSTFLILTAAMTLITGAYVGFPRKAIPDTGDHEPGHDPHDGVWFPEASIWPFAIGAGMVLVANGLLLGIWLLIPAAAFLAWALAGMIRQGRHRVWSGGDHD